MHSDQREFLNRLLSKSETLITKYFLLIAVVALFFLFMIIGVSIRLYSLIHTPQVLGTSTQNSSSSQRLRYISIDLDGQRILPRSMTIKAGTTVVWKSADKKIHTLSGSGFAGYISDSEYFSYTFGQAGTYIFKIDNNKDVGTITVQ